MITNHFNRFADQKPPRSPGGLNSQRFSAANLAELFQKVRIEKNWKQPKRIEKNGIEHNRYFLMEIIKRLCDIYFRHQCILLESYCRCSASCN